MKLATFEVDTPVGPVERIGVDESSESDDTPAGEATLVDLTAAYGAALEAEGEPAPADLARAHVPPEMIAFLERGDRAITDARGALEFGGRDGRRARSRRRENPVRTRRVRPARTASPAELASRLHGDRRARPEQYGRRDRRRLVRTPGLLQGQRRQRRRARRDDRVARLLVDHGLRTRDRGRDREAGRDIPAEEAEVHIAGYTVFNDFSARDIQGREMEGRLGPAKGRTSRTDSAPISSRARTSTCSPPR